MEKVNSLRKDSYSKAHSYRVNIQVKECINIKMEINILVSLLIKRSKELVFTFLQKMGPYMMDNGKMIRETGEES